MLAVCRQLIKVDVVLQRKPVMDPEEGVIVMRRRIVRDIRDDDLDAVAGIAVNGGACGSELIILVPPKDGELLPEIV